MNGKTVSINTSDGKKFDAYMATPGSGAGPGLLVIQEIFGVNAHIRDVVEQYAEEGYFAIAPDLFWRVQPGVQLGYDEEGIRQGRAIRGKFDFELGIDDIKSTIRALRAMPGCSGKAGVVGYCFGGLIAYLIAARTDVAAASCYYGGGIDGFIGEAGSVKCPIQFHYGSEDKGIPPEVWDKVRTAFKGRENAEVFVYQGAGHGFNCNRRASYSAFASQLARSRTIGLLRNAIGPRYDLGALWERHCALEFSERDADTTMATMTAQPYVNHVPTMTGGVGYEQLHRFYKHHFIPRLPPDTRIVPVSRTIGRDRLVDEILLCFTHDREVDFLLPGIPPTGKYVEIPTIAIVQFRGDKLYNEHIYWDQATALVQLGVLKPDGLPIAGIETAKKVLDESLPSNTLMAAWNRTRK